MKIKVVYNACFGGFGLSNLADQRLRELGATEDDINKFETGLQRHDVRLVTVVEALGRAAWGQHSELCTREVPFGSLYRIDDYDGREAVMLQDDYCWERAE